ncbi:STAS/SEC14 domain-containing protein [Arthrobacter sp. MSA 4-2]|nr:STAS/SEC14 domain-containing protein [Arthrobacter sp. MSA 4-2]
MPIEGGKGTLELRPDGVLHLKWDLGIHITSDDARAAMDVVNVLCADTSHPMLVDMEATRSVSRGARSTFSIPCGASRIALLGSSPVDRLLANFFLGLHSPPCPTHFFTSREHALDWLKRPGEAEPLD